MRRKNLILDADKSRGYHLEVTICDLKSMGERNVKSGFRFWQNHYFINWGSVPIFLGKNDLSLNTTYREYTESDFARPAFFQNLTYQADAKQIRFKEFVILIDEVTNEKITYTILEDGMK